MFKAIQRFFKMEAAGGILLMASAVLAVIVANSPLGDSYVKLWMKTYFNVSIGEAGINKPLIMWVNDGLMAIFFLMVGLEIKYEILKGQLASPKKALLPVAAAIGGMLVPAGIYALINAGSPTMNGWGVPMATDIAFALGVIILLGKRVPATLKVFLVAVAIVDDLGAVLVIAFFYTSKLSLTALGFAGLFLLALIAANKLGVRKLTVYCILGVALWVAFLKSGVHATLAGVLMALTIPSDHKLSPYGFMQKGKDALYKFMGSTTPSQDHMNAKQEHALHDIEHASREAVSPLHRLEHALHGWVTFLIVPVFAFANAGVSFAGIDIGAAITSQVALGIILGLFVGKQIGVFGFTWLAIKTGLAEMPARTTWRHIYGVSLLTGIGFTMSLFIASLAFGEGDVLNLAKIGIFAASLAAGIGGWFVLSSGQSAQADDDTTHADESDTGHEPGAAAEEQALKTKQEIEEFFASKPELERA